MRNGLWRDSVICQRGEREREMERKAESGRKDGESMNGSLGILQRQRDVCVPFGGASIYDISPLH